ncbi:MAG: polymer-forming cytoskeletal protein [bacterium]|nr:polymer-forming cytoskeletal protein [bacterium]
MFQRDGGQGPVGESVASGSGPGAGAQGATSAFLGKDTQLTGTVTFGSSARIEGQVEGQVTANGTLTIGESANLKATVNGTVIVVQGTVTGDITAKTRLELRSPSKVKGNIAAPVVVIQEGANFEGQCTMGEAAKAKLGVTAGPSLASSAPLTLGNAVNA